MRVVGRRTQETIYNVREARYEDKARVAATLDYAADRLRRQRELWASLHRYASQRANDWDPVAATQFVTTWEASIPSCCKPKYQRLAIHWDYSSPDVFFESSWLAHDTVSRQLISEGKPHRLFTLAEAQAIWFPMGGLDLPGADFRAPKMHHFGQKRIDSGGSNGAIP